MGILFVKVNNLGGVSTMSSTPTSTSTNTSTSTSTTTTIAIAQFTVTNTIKVGTGPRGVAITPDGDYAYVANWGSGTVSVIYIG
jgi:DNA-binding beta-propeller fold protein YncE